MRSFQQVVVFLFALMAFAFAQSSDTEKYDATVYLTTTVYRVNTITMSGSSYSAANQTSTIKASQSPSFPVVSAKATGTANGTTTPKPSGSGAKASASPSPFTGAASAMSANAYLAVLAASLGYLAL